MPAELAITAGRRRIAIDCVADSDGGDGCVCVHVCSRVRAHACAHVRVCTRVCVCMRDVFAKR